MSKIKEITHLNETLELPKSEIEKWNNYISKDFVDYDAEGFPELSTVWSKTVKFSDGFEIDLKVCTNSREDGDLWSEAVLFDKNGSEYSCTDCCYGIDGDFELSWFDNATGTMHEYRLTVKGV
jgi:hypothetical protein